MKTKFLVLAAVLATSLVAADFSGKTNAEVIASTDSKSPASLANSAFELDKRIGAQKKEIMETCFKFHNLMKNELNGKSPEEKKKFMDEFRKAYNAQLDSLSSAEKAEFNTQACKFGPKNDKIKHFKKDGKGGFNHAPKFGKDFNGTKPVRPKFGKGDAEIPPQPKPKLEPK
ncbi:MAG: DUF1104 domain-containing protein [Campylobacter sp.]|nr:DUF1104 domain-containing protein [Campylobacter sp.]